MFSPILIVLCHPTTACRNVCHGHFTSLELSKNKSSNANGHVCWFIDRPCHWRCCKTSCWLLTFCILVMKHVWSWIRLVYMALVYILYLHPRYQTSTIKPSPLKKKLCRLSFGEHWSTTYVSWCWRIFLLHCLLRFRAAPRDTSSAPRGTFARRGCTICWTVWAFTPYCMNKHIWVFPKLMVPQNGWFRMENPIKTDDLGVPLFLETPILIVLSTSPPTSLIPPSHIKTNCQRFFLRCNRHFALMVAHLILKTLPWNSVLWMVL